MSDETVSGRGTGEVLFQVENLHVTYRRPGEKAVEAVRGVSFDLHAGETLGIVGESGSGKSTIAKALMLLQPIAGGKVLFCGQDITQLNAADRRAYRQDVQMVFQDAAGSLNPRMTIRQTLAEVLKHTSGGARGRKMTPESLLSLVGLSEAVLDQYPRELSGGQCQRVSFARALAAGPRVLVADEPVSALDVSVQARILRLLSDLREKTGLSLLLITHDLSVVSAVCDSVYVLEHGRLVESGPAERVFSAPSHPYTRRLLAAIPRVPRMERTKDEG